MKSFIQLVLIFSLITIPVAKVDALGTTILVETNSDNITVNGFCSLREAIRNANADSIVSADCAAGTGNDTITFVGGLANSVITLGSALPEITDTEGLTILGLPFTSEGDFGVTISGNNLYRVFWNSAPFTIDTLIVKNGKSLFGGGVYNGDD